MQEQIEARAGLNGSGATRGECRPTPLELSGDTSDEGEGGGAAASLERPPVAADPAVAAAGGGAATVDDDVPLTHRERIRRLMADAGRYADIQRRVRETDESLSHMARELGVDKKAFADFVKEQDWPRPPTAPKPPRRLRTGRRRPAGGSSDIGVAKARLLSALDRQIDKVDARLRQKGAAVDEKDSRILGNLAKALNTMMQMGPGGATSNHAEPPDRDDDIEEQLTERIKRWARGEQGY